MKLFIPAPMHEVEEELERLFADRDHIRVATNNIIIYFENEDMEKHYVEDLQKVLQYHPSRTLWLLRGENQNEKTLTAYVSKTCVARLCNEEIQYQLSIGAPLKTFMQPVRATLIHDIPTIFFAFTHNKNDLDEIMNWKNFIDHIIIDSSTQNEIGFPMRGVIDFAWMRINFIQNHIANFLEMNELLDSMNGISRLVVRGTNDKKYITSIRYLLSWFFNAIHMDPQKARSMIVIKEITMDDNHFIDAMEFFIDKVKYTLQLRDEISHGLSWSHLNIISKMISGNTSPSLFNKVVNYYEKLFVA